MVMSSPGTVRIGISGWRYPPWRGVFHPSKLSQKKELAYASGVFRSIEMTGLSINDCEFIRHNSSGGTAYKVQSRTPQPCFQRSCKINRRTSSVIPAQTQ
jgi:hypothetical protein